MRRTLILASSLLLISSGAFAWGDGCAHRAERSLQLDADGLAALELLTRAGDLVVEGDAGLKRIEVHGKACASSEALLAQIQLSEQRAGNRQSVTTAIPETSGWNARASMDLVVRMPAGLHLQLQDSSGDARISGVASLDASDSSGDLNAEGIRGDVSLRDSSGDISISAIAGTVTVVSDSSGDMSIRDVRGDVIVQNDSSGDIHMEEIAGNAQVMSDSSGDIVVRAIGGNFSVDRDTSGDIRSRDVQGTLTLPIER